MDRWDKACESHQGSPFGPMGPNPCTEPEENRDVRCLVAKDVRDLVHRQALSKSEGPCLGIAAAQ